MKGIMLWVIFWKQEIKLGKVMLCRLQVWKGRIWIINKIIKGLTKLLILSPYINWYTKKHEFLNPVSRAYNLKFMPPEKSKSKKSQAQVDGNMTSILTYTGIHESCNLTSCIDLIEASALCNQTSMRNLQRVA